MHLYVHFTLNLFKRPTEDQTACTSVDDDNRFCIALEQTHCAFLACDSK